MKTEYKMLKRIIRTRTNFSILSMVRVKDKIAYATNMEEWIVIRDLALPDGMYEGDAVLSFLKDGIVPSSTSTKDNDYPDLPTIPEGGFSFPGSQYRHVFKFVSNDVSQYTLNGFMLSPAALVAINGRQLVYHKVDFPIEEKHIIPASLFEMGDCNLHIGKKQMWATAGNVSYACTKLDGKFPNYEMFLSKVLENKITISRGDLLKVLSISKHEEDRELLQMRFSVEGDTLYMKHHNPDIEHPTVYAIPCKHGTLTAWAWIFNPRLLKDCLSVNDSKIVTFEYNNHAAPFSIDRSKDGRIMLMPIKLDNNPSENRWMLSKAENIHHITGEKMPIKHTKAKDKRIQELETTVSKLQAELKTAHNKAQSNNPTPDTNLPEKTSPRPSVQALEGFPETEYIKTHATPILRLLKLKSNDFAQSLVQWVRDGKEWTMKQAWYAERLTV